MDDTLPPLSSTEVRVLGALIEKAVTTPDYYPLSLNAHFSPLQRGLPRTKAGS